MGAIEGIVEKKAKEREREQKKWTKGSRRCNINGLFDNELYRPLLGPWPNF